MLRKPVAGVGEIDALEAPSLGGMNCDDLRGLEMRLRGLRSVSKPRSMSQDYPRVSCAASQDPFCPRVGSSYMASRLRARQWREPVPCLRLQDFVELC